MRTLQKTSIRPVPDYESMLPGTSGQVGKAVEGNAGENAGIPKKQVTPKRTKSTDERIKVIAWHHAFGYRDMFFKSVADVDTWQKSGAGYGWIVEAIR